MFIHRTLPPAYIRNKYKYMTVKKELVPIDKEYEKVGGEWFGTLAPTEYRELEKYVIESDYQLSVITGVIERRWQKTVRNRALNIEVLKIQQSHIDDRTVEEVFQQQKALVDSMESKIPMEQNLAGKERMVRAVLDKILIDMVETKGPIVFTAAEARTIQSLRNMMDISYKMYNERKSRKANEPGGLPETDHPGAIEKMHDDKFINQLDKLGQ